MKLSSAVLALLCSTAALADTGSGIPADASAASASTDSNPLAGRKASELIPAEHHSSGRCDDYCMNPCGDFAWGGDTIIECNGCKKDDPKTKCFPGAEHYGDDWAEKTEL